MIRTPVSGATRGPELSDYVRLNHVPSSPMSRTAEADHCSQTVPGVWDWAVLAVLAVKVAARCSSL